MALPVLLKALVLLVEKNKYHALPPLRFPSGCPGESPGRNHFKILH